MYFVVEPEVAGSIGDRSILDRTIHPPRVTKLHYLFEGWLGDPLVESFPVFGVTGDLKRRFNEAGLSGTEFEDMEISTSDEFNELYPDRTLPVFERLIPAGLAGTDDIGTLPDGRLVVSQRALDVLKAAGVRQALISSLEN